jgi:hypothetical protein
MLVDLILVDALSVAPVATAGAQFFSLTSFICNCFSAHSPISGAFVKYSKNAV